MTIQNGAVIGSATVWLRHPTRRQYLKIRSRRRRHRRRREIGANTTIDRPAVGETRVRAGTKIDNLVQIGHGGPWDARAAGLAGRHFGQHDVEDNVVIGGQAGVGGHLRVGEGGTIVSRQDRRIKSVPAGEFLTGYPGIPNLDGGRRR